MTPVKLEGRSRSVGKKIASAILSAAPYTPKDASSDKEAERLYNRLVEAGHQDRVITLGNKMLRYANLNLASEEEADTSLLDLMEERKAAAVDYKGTIYTLIPVGDDNLQWVKLVEPDLPPPKSEVRKEVQRLGGQLAEEMKEKDSEASRPFGAPRKPSTFLQEYDIDQDSVDRSSLNFFRDLAPHHIRMYMAEHEDEGPVETKWNVSLDPVNHFLLTLAEDVLDINIPPIVPMGIISVGAVENGNLVLDVREDNQGIWYLTIDGEGDYYVIGYPRDSSEPHTFDIVTGGFSQAARMAGMDPEMGGLEELVTDVLKIQPER